MHHKLLLKLRNKLNSILNFENRSTGSRDMKFLWNISQNFKKWKKLRNSSKCHILGCLWFVFEGSLGELGSIFRLAFKISWDFGIRFGSFRIKCKNMDLSSFSKIPHSGRYLCFYLFSSIFHTCITKVQVWETNAGNNFTTH